MQNEEELDSHFPSTESPLYKHKLEEDLKKWSSIINRIKSANETLSANSNSDIDNVTSIMSRPQRRPSNTASLHRKISNFLVQNQISLEQLKYYVDTVGITTNPKILMSLEHRRNKRKRRSVDGTYCLHIPIFRFLVDNARRCWSLYPPKTRMGVNRNHLVCTD